MMDKQAAIELIRQTFEARFDEGRFRRFVHNLLNEIDESQAQRWQGAYIPDASLDHVAQYKRIGSYVDPDGETLDVLVVYLRHQSALEQARTMQRNFVARYLKGRGEKDAALVAYSHAECADWRFSLVRMAYDLTYDEATEQVKMVETLTPARRFSFLVGEGEPNHTAQQQLVPLLREMRHNPTLQQLQEAFAIESVTEEFFGQYKRLFLELKEHLDQLVAHSPALAAEFARAQIESAAFAKKLLGQLVFLYFLQKKGWLGVPVGASWGNGARHFLRECFEKALQQGQNFFNQLLEPLFYEALATKREGDFYSALGGKIPFLNGGLFEPLGGYRWREVDILLDNSLFQAIFETFDRYNFTVREDEPLEKEVAVDPEMLGKVFENLLEVRDRKSKGAFYTPREIVHYMCQESLINYLDTALNRRQKRPLPAKPQQASLFEPLPAPDLPFKGSTEQQKIGREALALFIRRGELGLTHDLAKGDGSQSDALAAPIRHHAAQLDEALANIKICDPAIGSGAFPVGLMQEIVKARSSLSPFLPASSERTLYALKRHAIQRSIYGVDLDPAAVDIAKLRLWLSLVVDEEQYQQIKPLPNLDYKIVCGNALLGIKLDMLNYQLFAELAQLKKRYFDATAYKKKQALKGQIEQIIAQLTQDQALFDFNVYFHEIFEQQKGFDVVIGNPPYVRHELIKALKPALKKEHAAVYSGTADLYVYFYAQGLNILRPDGVLAYITSNKFMRAGYGKKLRQRLGQQSSLQQVIDFGDLPVFDATAYPCILITQQKAPTAQTELTALTVTELAVMQKMVTSMQQQAWKMPQQALTANGWRLEAPHILALLEKLRRAGTPLGEYIGGRFYYGIKTGYNKAFVIDGATRERLIAEDPSSAEVIKPFLRGRDVKRWAVNFAEQYLIKIESSHNTSHPWTTLPPEEAEQVFAESYPAIYAHFNQFRAALIKRYDQGKYFWELRACAYWAEFEQPKIMYQEIATYQAFAWENSAAYSNNKTFIIPNASIALLSILNSKTTWFFLDKIVSKLTGGAYAMQSPYVSQLPIPPLSAPQQAIMEGLVKQILTIKQENPNADVSALEAQIDQLVYQLYGLTEQEIAIIEGR